MSSGAFPLDEAQLVGLCMASILYGAYVVSLLFCLRVLLFDNRAISKFMLVAAILMAIFGTLNVAFALRFNLDAFVWYKGPGGPTGEFGNISYWVNVMKTVDYVVQTLIGDLILIYRCYVVYNRRWSVIVVSIVFWTGLLVCASAAIYIEVHLKLESSIHQKQLVPFITAGIILSIAQNIYTTGLIAGRLWVIDRQSRKYLARENQKLRHVLIVLLESGAVYTVNQGIFLGLYVCSNNALYGVSDCTVQITGIVFNVIITRVHQGRTIDQTKNSTGILSRKERLTGTAIIRGESHHVSTIKKMPESPATLNSTYREAGSDSLVAVISELELSIIMS